jgi:hypothetical protein
MVIEEKVMSEEELHGTAIKVELVNTLCCEIGLAREV